MAVGKDLETKARGAIDFPHKIEFTPKGRVFLEFRCFLYFSNDVTAFSPELGIWRVAVTNAIPKKNQRVRLGERVKNYRVNFRKMMRKLLVTRFVSEAQPEFV